MITGLLKPDSGRILINGENTDTRDNRQLVGLCPQEIVLWNNLTCFEQLVFIAEMYNVPEFIARKRADTLLERIGLSDKRKKLVKTLSGGMQRRINLLMALMHDPEILILDEPEVGLDPQSRVMVRDFIHSLSKTKAVIFTTHNMDEADRLCDRIGIIDHSKMLVTDSPENLMGNSQAKSEFDIYAPGIFIFSIIMLLLSASLSIIRDVEDKTMIRLKLTKMTVFDYLIGNTFVQWVIGVFSFGLTYWLAILLGFNSQGSALLVLLVCSLTILSIIAVCLILVSFCKNATTVMIVGNFPLFILMFFTGSMIPLPRNEIVAGYAINDILPPTHAVNALNKIFTFGAGLKDISHEILMLFLLTIVYYTVGIYLFRKKHLLKT